MQMTSHERLGANQRDQICRVAGFSRPQPINQRRNCYLRERCGAGSPSRSSEAFGRVRLREQYGELACPAEAQERSEQSAFAKRIIWLRFGGISLRLEPERRLASTTGFEPVF